MMALMRRAAVFASAARYEPLGLEVLEAAMRGEGPGTAAGRDKAHCAARPLAQDGQCHCSTIHGARMPGTGAGDDLLRVKQLAALTDACGGRPPATCQ
jgi:hypothetical protein